MNTEEYLSDLGEILTSERRAKEYYRDVLIKLKDGPIKEVIAQIEKEEEGHVKAIETIYLKRKAKGI